MSEFRSLPAADLPPLTDAVPGVYERSVLVGDPPAAAAAAVTAATAPGAVPAVGLEHAHNVNGLGVQADAAALAAAASPPSRRRRRHRQAPLRLP